MNKLNKIKQAIAALENKTCKGTLTGLLESGSLDLVLAYVKGAYNYSCGSDDDETLGYIVELLK